MTDRAPDAALTPMAPVPDELRPLADRYELFGELGRGGMSVVYRARARGGAREAVAVKVLSAQHAGDAATVQRFAREARVAAALDHPNVVRTLAVEPLDGGAVAIVTRLVDGVTLRALLREAGGPLDFARAAGVLRDVAAALAYAHARRLVHRDVKPENVFVEAATGRALLADFGIARPLDAESPLTVDGGAVGTPTYMAPEQVAGRAVDERTDVYALGLVGWELLAGRRPWQGETLYALLHRQQYDELPDLAALRPDIPAYLLAAVRGALAKDPAGRWRDGAEFLARLTPAAAALPPGDGPAAGDGGEHEPTVVVPAAGRGAGAGARGAGRGRALAGVASVAALLALGGGGVAAWRAREAALRAADAAVTGVTDEALDAALRQARVAADGAPAGPAPAPRGYVPPASAPPASARRAAPPAAAVDPALAADVRCASPASRDQRACLLAAAARGDRDLTAVYAAVIAGLRRAAGGAAEPPGVRALRAEQRAWLAARDRRCRAAVPAGRTALWGAARAPCFQALSARRAAELRARLAAGG